MKGKVRGIVFKTHMAGILKCAGEEGLRAVEETTRKLGYPIDYRKIKTSEWYPAVLDLISLSSIKKALDLTDEDFFQMGYHAQRVSPILKLLLKYFVSPGTVARKAPEYWRKHWSVGEMEPVLIDEENGRCILRLKNFKSHPLACAFLRGYILSALELTIGKDRNSTIEETKCAHKGDEYHEFLLKWKTGR